MAVSMAVISSALAKPEYIGCCITSRNNSVTPALNNNGVTLRSPGDVCMIGQAKAER
jgi:hypothetical protein